MKENASLATNSQHGGAKAVLQEVLKLVATDPSWEIHLAGHSAGSIFMAPVVEWLCEQNQEIASVTLWAPACTMDLFRASYLPYIKNGKVQQFSLFTLKDAAEQDDDCAKVYNKSLLYLVSNALESKPGFFFADGEPLLGMEEFILEAHDVFQVPTEKELRKKNPAVVKLFGLSSAEWIRSPNGLPAGESPNASHARRHGDFDDDKATVLSTLARIVDKQSIKSEVEFEASASALRDCRRRL